MATNNITHLDLDSEEFEDSPKGLREYAKKLKAAYEAQTTELDGVRGRLNSQAVSKVLEGKGFKNPKRVEKDLLAEGVDPLDKEAVDGWLAEFGDDYAKGEGTSAPAQTEKQQAQQAAHEQLAAGAEFRTPADASKHDLAFGEITEEMTGADVDKLFKARGI